MRKVITNPNGPQPGGPYSPAVLVDNHVFVSGQLGMTPDRQLADNFEDQMRLAMDNLINTLAAAGAAEPDIAHINVYLVQRDDFTVMNEIYREYFTEPYPARTTVEAGLQPGVLFEVDAHAIVRNDIADDV